MSELRVNTISLLREVQEALELAEQRGDEELMGAAESILSALVVVLRKRHATLPEALGPHLATIVRRHRKA